MLYYEFPAEIAYESAGQFIAGGNPIHPRRNLENGASTTALLLGLVTATPALAMLPQMNKRGQVVISACLVSCVCVFGAHFAYANNLYPEMVPAMLAAKLAGGLLSGFIAMLSTRTLKESA